MSIKSGTLSFVFCLFLLLGCLSRETYACSCFPVSSGAEYEMAKGVYKGKLVKTERSGERSHLLHYYFEIRHTYKGAEAKVLKLTYPDTDCRKPFEAGQDYLIYEEAREVQRYCNRTAPISALRQDLEFLDRFQSDKPLLKIEGFIPKFSDDPVSETRVKIRSGDSTQEAAVDKDGFFSAVLKSKQNYIVVVTFPIRGEVEVTDGLLDFRNSIRVSVGTRDTVLEYDVDLTKTFADYRRIAFGISVQ